MAVEAQIPYQALYRRFRPQRFSEVLGQGHVTRALRSAVRDGKVAHAYLFSGPRGTGKTSTARILAMALNCERAEDGEPCGGCESCVAIRTGVSLDVQELDSATNRGIDEMRDLLSRVALGTPGRWKVYIVDEVHQITSAAASALLKTLEEPPAHVIFVLATTDPQKVLDTIRSRTQHFEFRLLGSEVLAGLLTEVATRADLELTPEAIDVVVRRGHGSARDALSALDQVVAAGAVEDDSTLVLDLVEVMIERDAGSVLVKVAEAAASGLDPRRLGTELLEHLRNAFLATQAPELVLLSGASRASVEDQAKRLGAAALVRAMDLIGASLIDMRDSADPRTTLEVALVRLAAPEMDDSRAALLERIERLERALAAPGSSPRPAAAGGAARAGSGAEAAGDIRDAPDPDAQPSVPPNRGRAPASTAGAPTGGGPSAGDPTPPGSGSPPRSLGAAPPMPGRPLTARGVTTPPGPASGHPQGPAGPDGLPDPPGPGVVPDRSGAGGLPVASPAPVAADSGAPSREELTVAWGDRILPSLRPAVKVYVANGRFLPSEGGVAVYAVPDRGLLGRAEANRAEVEEVLAAQFGRPVALRLVLDPDAPPVGGGRPAAPSGDAGPDRAMGPPGGLGAGGLGVGRPGSPQGPPTGVRSDGASMAASPPAPPPDDDVYDWADMEEVPAALSSPEQRLLEAFPGAEEVQP